MRVSVQMNVCRRNRTDWCSEKEFTACSSADDRADIMFTVFQAGARSGVNIQQYQRGQRTSLLLLLTDQYAGESSGMPSLRPTMVSRCEQFSLMIVRVSILNLHL